MVNLASIMERADEALLPGVYREIGLALQASPAQLGSLTFVRSLVQAICGPLAAYASVHHNRANVIAVGAVLWALATFFVGISVTFTQMAVARALNGVGLAMVVPAIFSLVADSANEHERGSAFGWLQVTSHIGTILGGLLSVSLAGGSFMGIPGWRLSFHLVAILSVIVAVLVHNFAVDPLFSGHALSMDNKKKGVLSTVWESLKTTWLEAKQVMQIHTFQIIVAQGVAGSFPWAALAFMPMLLELIGFSHGATAVLLGLFTVTTAIGGLFGGKMGDLLSYHLPNSGRIILSQISSGLGVPLAAVLLLVFPINNRTFAARGIAFSIVGFFISWNMAATNAPIFAEIVPEKLRTSVYALDRSFESLLASFAPPVVGILAEQVYGYIPPHRDVDQGTELIIDKENAGSLSKALYTAMGIPWLVCCLIYTLLYWTYPRDRDHARSLALTINHVGHHIRLEEFAAKDENKFVILDEDDEESDFEKIESGSQKQRSHGESEHILSQSDEV